MLHSRKGRLSAMSLSSLRCAFFELKKVTRFKHLAVATNHLLDVDRVMAAIFRAEVSFNSVLQSLTSSQGVLGSKPATLLDFSRLFTVGPIYGKDSPIAFEFITANDTILVTLCDEALHSQPLIQFTLAIKRLR